jgi:predicted metal-dependent peptidase
MSDDAAEIRCAESKIELVKERLARRYPFHVALLSRMRIVARQTIATLAVTSASENLLLLHNPQWVLECPVPELGGAVLHEIHHVVLGHLSMTVKDYPDRWALTIAQEVTANEYVIRKKSGMSGTAAAGRSMIALVLFAS